MPSVSIRDATEADVATLVDFVLTEARESEGTALDPATVTASVTAALRDPALARYWLAVDPGGGVRGAIGVVREWSDWRNTSYWWIQFVFVAAAARGAGIVEQLVGHVQRAASAAAAPELRLYVHPGNARAIRVYERLGFAAWQYRVMAQPIAPPPAGGVAAALDDAALWYAFHDRTLPAAQWTHAAHLRIAWLHLARHPLDEAHLLMRVGIIRLNLAHGLIETATRGYHETLTRVWLALVGAVRRRVAGADSTAIPLEPALARDAPLAYYSRDRLFSLAARTAFVPPDLAELPPSGPSRIDV
jgi:ribosomal protein S18 acetylase RimI-like enzyme